MDEIFIPKEKESESGTGRPGYLGYDKYLIPDGLREEDKSKIYLQTINRLVKKTVELEDEINKQKKDIDEYRNDLKKQTSRNIEIIGIFSSILALLIIDVSIIKSVDTFLAAFLLIIGLTCSLVIFVSFVHLFFSPEDKKLFDDMPKAPVYVLIILFLVALIMQIFEIDIKKFKNSQKSTTKTEVYLSK